MKLLLVILFLGCQSIPKLKDNQAQVMDFQKFKNNIQGFCLNGEGKGRIQAGDQGFTLSYETSNPDPNNFILTVYIPFRGGEDLNIQRVGTGYKFSGGFLKMIKSRFFSFADSSPNYEREDLNRFLLFLGEEIFKTVDFSKKSDQELNSYFSKWCTQTPGLKCTSHSKEKITNVMSHSSDVTKNTANFDLVWKSTNLTNDITPYYKQSFFELNKATQTILSARLYVNQCQSGTSRL